MFKKILFSTLIAMFLCAGLAVAQPTDPVAEDVVVEEAVEPTVVDLTDQVDILPVLKQGIIYSVDDQELSYAFTTQILEWEGVSLEGGYAAPDTLLGVVSYRLGGLERLGVNVPVLDLLDCNVGYYVGWKDMNNSSDSKFDHGVAATLLNIKF